MRFFVRGLRGEVQKVHSSGPKGPLFGSSTLPPPKKIDPGCGPALNSKQPVCPAKTGYFSFEQVTFEVNLSYGHTNKSTVCASQVWKYRGGSQYKRPYGDVPPTWVAKSASWYMNDPFIKCKIWYVNGSVFKNFSQI